MIAASIGISLPLSPSGIAEAVPALVVVPDGRDAVLEGRDPADDLRTADGVLPHDHLLGPVEALGLREDRVGHSDLSDVVEERGGAERPELLGREPRAPVLLRARRAAHAVSDLPCTGRELRRRHSESRSSRAASPGVRVTTLRGRAIAPRGRRSGRACARTHCSRRSQARARGPRTRSRPRTRPSTEHS